VCCTGVLVASARISIPGAPQKMNVVSRHVESPEEYPVMMKYV